MRRLGALVAMLGAFLALAVAPASAGECGFPRCGGDVHNNYAGQSIIISNCWPDGAAEWTVYRTWALSCQTNGYNENAYNARMWLNEGVWSYNINKHWYDVDAIGFPAYCQTRWHKYGESTSARTFDNRGYGDRAWMKIGNLRVIYIDAIIC